MTPTKRIPRKRTSRRRGPICSICKHENRVLIEQTRIAGASLDSLALKFGCSRDAVHRHMANHVSQDLLAQYLADAPIKELAQRAAAEGMSVLQYLSLIRSTLMNEFQLAAAVHDRHATSALAGRLNEVLRSIGSISGELGDMARSITINGNVLNVMNHPQLANLQANILTALRPFPEAKGAVIAALKSMDAVPVDGAASASPPTARSFWNCRPSMFRSKPPEPAGQTIAAQLADALANDWRTRLRKEQLAPLGDWLIWLFMGGRGTGKTLAGGNFVHELVQGGYSPDRLDALVWALSELMVGPEHVPTRQIQINFMGR